MSKSNYIGQERESLRLGHQAATVEKVVEAREDKSCLAKAKAARYQQNGEPSAAPDHDDATAERAVTASKGSKSK